MRMKTSTFEKGIPMLSRIGVCLSVLLGTLLLSGPGCNEAGEGDRCNPLRTSDECGSGLVCSGNPLPNSISASHPIAFCPENYCCPADLSQSTNPNCQPGCNGGAAAICAADSTNTGACACADDGECAADAATSSTSEGGSDESAAPDAGQSTVTEGGEASTSD